MSDLQHPTRRAALAAAAGLGISVTFLARQAFAASEGALARRKLVVVICRGAMDGLSVAPPVGDPDYAGLRGEIAIAPDQALRLDSTFGLHPKLKAIHALALKGQARIAPAIATPDRARSHFEAQDVLESGSATVYGANSGWLNRAMEALGPQRKVQALSIGAQAPLILRGRIQAASWSPGGYKDNDRRLPAILADLYAGDPVLGPALASGLETEAMAGLAAGGAMARPAMAPQPAALAAAGDPAALQQAQARNQQLQRDGARTLGQTLARFMTEPGGPQIAAVEIDGFDTHANQGAAEGQLAGRLGYLDGFVEGLNGGLGQGWSDTVVLAATEFGRTAKVNGTRGTDHGTASTALLIGGAVAPGGLIGDWPTLAPAKLFENRDTAPTADMRALFKGVLHAHLGLDRRSLDTLVFPGSEGAAPLANLVT
jgi:uncharacterized protein (DUF1501 family)